MRIRLINWQRDKKFLLYFLIFYLVSGAALFIFQEKLVYYPDKRDFNQCSRFAPAEIVEFNGTRMYFKKNGPKVAVFYHGNAGSACDRDFWGNIFENNNYSYLMPEYAGYSGDTRSPSHEGVKQDVRNVIGFLSTQNFSEVLIAGESIGSGAASYHASIEAPNKLLLTSPFTNLSDIARRVFWYYPVFLLVDDAFMNQELLKNYQNNLLIIHGEEDDVVPHKLGLELFEKISSQRKRMVSVPNAGHNDLFAFPETYTAIYDFLGK